MLWYTDMRGFEDVMLLFFAHVKDKYLLLNSDVGEFGAI